MRISELVKFSPSFTDWAWWHPTKGFFHLDFSKGHLAYALEHPEVFGSLADVRHPVKELFKRGWIRITRLKSRPGLETAQLTAARLCLRAITTELGLSPDWVYIDLIDPNKTFPNDQLKGYSLQNDQIDHFIRYGIKALS